MMFKRLRRSPPKFIAFRLVCLSCGLLYAFTATDALRVLDATTHLAVAFGATAEQVLDLLQPQTEKAGTSK